MRRARRATRAIRARRVRLVDCPVRLCVTLCCWGRSGRNGIVGFCSGVATSADSAFTLTLSSGVCSLVACVDSLLLLCSPSHCVVIVVVCRSAGRKRDADLNKRATVTGAIVRVGVSLVYKREASSSSSSSSSESSTEASLASLLCGPHVSVTVDGKVVFMSSDAVFNAQGMYFFHLLLCLLSLLFQALSADSSTSTWRTPNTTSKFSIA